MWDRQKTDIFNKIKAINPNAKASNYENKTVNEMLKILQSYKDKSSKFKSSDKLQKADMNSKNVIISNKDYDTDESTESKFDQGLEYYNLKDIDSKSFDVIEKEENKLEEKASIDWNNFLTKKEVKDFLNKDDKIESAENIIYNTKGNFFNKYWKDFKKSGWTKQELVKDLENFYTNGHLITEGIHLIAYVKDKTSGEYSTIEDRDYNSKKDFERELKANGYSNISILDNRDMYLIDNTNYTRVSQLKKELNNLKKDIKTYDKEKYPFLYKDTLNKYNKLKEVYDNVMKISLTEGYVLKGMQDGKSFDISYNDNKEKLQKFKDELQPSHKDVDMHIVEENKKLNESLQYADDSDIPRYNDTFGLTMQIDGTKKRIATIQARLNKAKYDADKNKYKHHIQYLQRLLKEYEDALHDAKDKKTESDNSLITLYHNTTNENAIKISKEGIKGGMRLDVYGKGSEAEGSGIWCSTVRGYGYGGATITFQVNKDERVLRQQNDTEYILYRDVTPNEISDIDLVVSNISALNTHSNTLESDIPQIIIKYGKEKTLNVYKKYENKFVEPYNYEQLMKLIETGNKYCKGKIQLKEDKDTSNIMPTKQQVLNEVDTLVKKYGKLKVGDVLAFYIYNNGDWYMEDKRRSKINAVKEVIENNYTDNPKDDFMDEISTNKYILDCIEKTEKELNSKIKTESKQKIEEVSRNDMLAKAKSQTITRYNKAPGYKGFSIVDIDTTSVFTTNSLRVTCRVGDYWDTVEMENILYWIQVEAEKNPNYQINTKGITAAIMNSIDGMDIKVDCTCPDFKYRFAYMATKFGYKYGKPENREAKITNPNDYGSICKHLISMLSNKKWLQQVTSTVMDFIVKRIDDVNKFLRVKEGEELTLPNELARQNAKKGFYTKLFGKDDANNDQDEENNEEDLQDVDKDISNDNEDSNNNDNTIDNQSNVDTEEDQENNEK
jgi:hypothetical protein